MTEQPRFLGINEMVEEVADRLSRATFRVSASEASLEEDVALITQQYLNDRLGPLGLQHNLWRNVAEQGIEGIRPANVFGNAFVPDLAIDVAQKPALALFVRLLRPGALTSDKIGAAIGAAIICSRQYPAVLVLLLRSGEYVDYMHFLDREITMDLWHTCKVKLIAR